MDLKILFVDDEENILNSLKRDMILTPYSSTMPLMILKNEHVDVIVSDMKMPKMDGIRFLEKYKKFIHILAE